ncbi:MAG: hypothetical protein A2090_05005 [Deltaproteobacteria bacterium GWD2_42_10]|nr:MAG: hypothetical protein A2090_05005 [Deltaproteobacteria bacterium GWD2_42_10]
MNKAPLLYYRTTEQIEEYRKRPVLQKIKWLEAQMEFFYYAMPDKAKRIREHMQTEKRTQSFNR